MSAPGPMRYRGIEIDRVHGSGMYRAFRVPGAPTAFCFADTLVGMRQLIDHYRRNPS